ncbi:MAG: ABC transporter substrate-binding protein [Frankia sp.]
MVAMGAALVLGAAACGSSGKSSGSGSSSSGKEILIGGIVAETGTAPYEGANEAISAYFNQLNAAGGINGYTVKYKGYDSTGSAQTNAALMSKLVGQHAAAVIVEDPQGAPGGYQVAERAGVPVIGGYAYPALYQSPTLYPVASFFAGSQTKVMFQVMHDEGVTKIALLTINVPVGVETVKAYTAQAGKYGLKIVSSGLYAPTQTDFTGYASKAVSAGAQAVFQIGGYTQGIAVAKALEQQNSSAKLVFAAGYNTSIARQVGSWGNGKVFSGTPLLTLPMRSKVQQALKTAGYSKVDASSGFVSLGWSDAEIATEGVRLLGSNTPKAANMVKALDSISGFKGTFTPSPLTYGSGPHTNPSQCVQIQEMENGVLGLYKGKPSVCFTGSVAPTS